MPDRKTLVTQHSDAVWRTVRRLLNDDDDARECYQQTFLEALQMRDSDVRCWHAVLCRIATHRALDVLRRKYRERERFRDLVAEPSQQISVETEIQWAELRQAVRAALAVLPTLQAEAFWLRHIEQMSPQEIGEQLGIDPGHVRVLVHRAAGHLRHALQPSFGALFSAGAKR